MATTLASVQDDIEAARTAMKAGEWASAKTYALSAQLGLLGVPDSEFGRGKTTFDRASFKDLVDGLVREARQAAASARGGVQVTKFRTKRVSC